MHRRDDDVDKAGKWHTEQSRREPSTGDHLQTASRGIGTVFASQGLWRVDPAASLRDWRHRP